MIWLHHVGFAVKDIDSAAKFYAENPLFDIQHLGPVAEFGVKSAFIFPKGSTALAIEIVQPIDNGARYGQWARNFLDAKGEGIFYFALFSDSYDEDIAALKRSGYQVLEEEYTSLFPGNTLRLAWFDADKIHGYVDLVDARSVPKAAGGLAP
jgi:catechol 2,3-dioxygenase-like lactoylglutathione lyase family enzyme